MAKREWVLNRNCSISPRQLLLAYALLCGMSLTVVVITFTLSGVWYILGFAFFELCAVGLAFLIYARHASDRELIELGDDWLVVELVQVEQVRRFSFNPKWTRVQEPVSRGDLVGLEANGMRVEVGRFLTEWKRRELARELRRALAAAG